MPSASRILFGDYLNVTDEGGGVIRVDGCPSGGCDGCFELPTTLPEIPATPTAQDVTDALVALGLVTQL